MSKIIDLTKRFRPRVADPKLMMVVSAAFAVGVLIVAWLGTSLRLEADGARLGWAVLVAFGMAWHGDIASAWRIAAGLIAGAMAGLAGYYGALSIFPVTPRGLAMGLAITAAGVAVIAHLLPRILSFAGAVVGFGVGIAAAGQFPFRPTTPADDLFSLALVVATAFAMGCFGSVTLRAVVARVTLHRAGAFARLIRHRPAKVVESSGSPAARRPVRRPAPRRAAGAAR
ncbi:MAG: hypothetical protein WD646_14220 [Actinomycetota bacterium]